MNSVILSLIFNINIITSKYINLMRFVSNMKTQTVIINCLCKHSMKIAIGC